MFSQNEKQSFVEVYGVLKSESESLKNAQIQIKENDGEWQYVKFNKRNGEFDLALPLGNQFAFRFSQPETVEKIITFSTQVPEEYARVSFAPFFFIVRLETYTNQPEIDTLFYNEPVGKIYFSEEFIKFDYDRQYNLFVQNKIENTQKLLASREVDGDKIDEPEALVETSIADSVSADMLSSLDFDTIQSDSNLFVDLSSDSLEVGANEQLMSDSLLIAEEVRVSGLDTVGLITETEMTVSEEVVLADTSTDEKDNRLSLLRPVEENVVNDPQPVDIGKKNGKEYDFETYENKQVTKIYITKSGKTIIYSMYQYNNGRTNYYKQQPLSNDSITISREIFTKAVR